MKRLTRGTTTCLKLLLCRFVQKRVVDGSNHNSDMNESEERAPQRSQLPHVCSGFKRQRNKTRLVPMASYRKILRFRIKKI